MKLYETINAKNWWKHDIGGCLVGQAQTIYPLEIDRKIALRALDEACWALFRDRLEAYQDVGSNTFRPTVRLNDHPDTTLEDVLRVCKLADV